MTNGTYSIEDLKVVFKHPDGDLQIVRYDDIPVFTSVSRDGVVTNSVETFKCGVWENVTPEEKV